MKLFFVLAFLTVCSLNSFCQKLPIDSTAVRRWPSLNGGLATISNDGNYFMYSIKNQPRGTTTLVVQSTSGSWKREYRGVETGIFSKDSRQIIFQSADTLWFSELGTNRQKYVSHINSYQFPPVGKGKWIAYQLKDSEKELVLLDLLTGKEQRFLSVTGYSFDNTGNTLVIKTESLRDSSAIIALQWISLTDEKRDTIWSVGNSLPGKWNLGRWGFDEAGKQIAFMVGENDSNTLIKENQLTETIWYYTEGMEKAVCLVTNQSPGIEGGFTIGSFPLFSKNGKWIFFQLQSSGVIPKPGLDAVKVNIWSYKDVDLQPEQLQQLARGPKAFVAVVNTKGGDVVRLQQEGEYVYGYGSDVSGDYVVIVGKKIESWWKFNPQTPCYIVSLKDGARRFLKKGYGSLGNLSFSPGGKYLVYFDNEEKAYFSYNIMTGHAHNITQAIPTGVIDDYSSSTTHYAVAPVAGWLKGDTGLLVYDNYDIWRIDPSGSRPPTNITNGYGLKHRLKFRLAYGDERVFSKDAFDLKESLLITAFSPINKYNGFFRKILGEKGDPELLTLGPYTFYRTNSQKPYFYSFDDGMQPLKAANANAWIVKRQTASEAPNYFLTKDFKTFKQLSNLQPQKEYNWLTSELVTWKQLDGSMSQGILYKPENFDPNKKYPLIFYYYRQFSFRLYEFPEPGFTEHNLNIPWFVSNGYLVFTPDIHYKLPSKSGKTSGEWAYNSIVSAAQYMSKMPYIDAKRMAIQGHSFGGGLTNYLVTHTHLFAAAAEVAGSSDPISSYLSLVLNWPLGIESGSKQSGYEGEYGATPWERPDLYRKNSAVLNADKATTPLLIMHNEKDNSIPWRQGIELYMALRRLGKKVWMLQYDDEHHGLIYEKNAVDYTIRLMQFFDHYLKGVPAPRWMTQGIPAHLKGIDDGLELDYEIKTPGPGLLMDEKKK